jgi:hypothetical protein
MSVEDNDFAVMLGRTNTFCPTVHSSDSRLEQGSRNSAHTISSMRLSEL